MLHSVFQAPMSFFDTTPSGRILNKSSTDQTTLDIFLPFFMGECIASYFTGIAIIIVTCQVAWPTIFVIVPVAWVNFWYQPSVVYLAVADGLLEDRTLLEGWSDGIFPYEKKRLDVVSAYLKYPYLVQLAIDYEVCLQDDVFVGNSFSTFSNMIAMQRTVRTKRVGPGNGCENPKMATYAYNIEGAGGGPQRWSTNMSDLSLEAISYGSNEVSCM